MFKEKEEKFSQGHSNKEVVKVGNTARRAICKNSEYVHELLQHLEEKRYPYSPKFVGMDDKGREILTFLDGDIARGDIDWTDEQLRQITRMIKEFHNATEGSNLVGDKEVVCHNDLAPWNLVIKNSKPVGFIDFDDSTPGYRIDDFAYFLWTFLDLGRDISVKEQGRKIQILSKEYGEFKPKKLIKSILRQQKKILKKRRYLSKNANTKGERHLSKTKIDEIKSEMEWVRENKEEIIKILEK
jgi:tRNA A-37 threonylcarbamoyl transferase component Bud32